MSYGTKRGAELLGLRDDTPTYKDLTSHKKANPIRVRLRAFCTSLKCTGSEKGLYAIEVHVRRGTIDCPHCEHALYWGDPKIGGMAEIEEKLERGKKCSS